MKLIWTEEELVTDWTLHPPEQELLRERRDATRLGFALQLKFFHLEGRFPGNPQEIPVQAIRFVAQQVGVEAALWKEYPWYGRMAKYHRAEIREWFGFREVTKQDVRTLRGWLVEEVLGQEHRMDRLLEVVLERFKTLHIEPPTADRLKRHISSTVRFHENRFCEEICRRLNRTALDRMECMLQPQSPEGEGSERTAWQTMRTDPGRAGVESVRDGASRLRQVQEIGLPQDLFRDVPPKLLERYAKRATVEEAFELRRHATPLRSTLLAAYLLRRSQDLVDHLVDLLVETIHKMDKRAGKRVEEEVSAEILKVPGKFAVLFRIAEASLAAPKGVVDEVIYPVAPEKLLRSIAQEFQTSGPARQKTIRAMLQRSYRSHYRRMLPELLGTLEFRCTNPTHQPVMHALALLKAHLQHKGTCYPEGVDVPMDGVVRPIWMPLVVEEGSDGKTRINRIAYEICVLEALRKRLRCREIWVVGGRRYRDPEEDLPQDFEVRRAAYYAELGIPTDAKAFTETVRKELQKALQDFDEGLPSNPNVKILPKKNGWIALSPYDALPEPENLADLKGEINHRWSLTSLLDVLKETDMRTGLTRAFRSGTEREHMDRHLIQHRLLRCLYGLGTNTGLKSMASEEEADYKGLIYIRRRFISVEQLRQAIATVANATLNVRRPQVW